MAFNHFLHRGDLNFIPQITNNKISPHIEGLTGLSRKFGIKRGLKK